MASALRLLALTTLFTLAISLYAAGPAHGDHHVRLRTARGPVHVWTPAHYDPATAGVVVYVHGYFTDVDAAWTHHRLARQFAASKLNAMFIACEAPRSPRADVNWTSLGELRGAVEAATGTALPGGRTVVVGHSAAHRTITQWLAEPIDTIVLVDALYGNAALFRAWLDADAGRRFIDAATLTRRWSEDLHASIPDTLVFDRFPAADARLAGARSARVVYVRSQHDHMALITGGIALPMLLRALQLPGRSVDG